MTEGPKSEFVYVTYIRTTAEKLWAALTGAEFAKQYWRGASPVSDWKVGSPWKLQFPDGRLADSGEIVACEPNRKLAIRWRNEWSDELKKEGYSLCTMEIEPVEGTMKLTVTHGIERPNSNFIKAVSGGWPQILANLKSLLETGAVILGPKYK